MDIKSEAKTIQEFVDKGNYHAATNIAISALNECRRNNDQAGIDTFLDIIKGIANTMDDEFGS
jgi:hypothetical protein